MVFLVDIALGTVVLAVPQARLPLLALGMTPGPTGKRITDTFAFVNNQVPL
jgi:hypothetical protein